MNNEVTDTPLPRAFTCLIPVLLRSVSGLTEFDISFRRSITNKMNEVLKNTHTFVEVLKMAKCEAVERWDEAALHRAYKWAQYFEEVS